MRFDVRKGKKIAIYAENSLATTALYKILAGEDTDFEGTFKWGVTITSAYLPSDNGAYFKDKDMNLVDYFRQYTTNMDETDLRGFLGRMLFSGEEKKKIVRFSAEEKKCVVC